MIAYRSDALAEHLRLILETAPDEVRTAIAVEVERLDEIILRLHADGDRLREELDRQAAEIERLRNKRAQTCACAAGQAVWCTACMRAEAASQQARNRGLMRAAVDAIDGTGLLAAVTRLSRSVEQMRRELTKGEVGT